MFLVHSEMTGKRCRVELFHQVKDAEKRFPFNCSNNVITVGINIIAVMFYVAM